MRPPLWTVPASGATSSGSDCPVPVARRTPFTQKYFAQGTMIGTVKG